MKELIYVQIENKKYVEFLPVKEHTGCAMKRSRKPVTERIISIIRQVPEGKVATYGQIAAYAGSRRAARQVSWVLHSSSEKENLPWHRIVNSSGRISLKPKRGYELQKSLLLAEGILFDEDDRIDLENSRWNPQ